MGQGVTAGAGAQGGHVVFAAVLPVPWTSSLAVMLEEPWSLRPSWSPGIVTLE